MIHQVKLIHAFVCMFINNYDFIPAFNFQFLLCLYFMFDFFLQLKMLPMYISGLKKWTQNIWNN